MKYVCIWWKESLPLVQQRRFAVADAIPFDVYIYLGVLRGDRFRP